MIESILSNLGEIFLDLLITRSLNKKISKKKQVLSIIVLLFIAILYVSIFVLSLKITLSAIHNNPSLAIKMGIVDIILFIILLIYTLKIYHQWKNKKKRAILKQLSSRFNIALFYEHLGKITIVLNKSPSSSILN